jgi:hypothetical protein
MGPVEAVEIQFNGNNNVGEFMDGGLQPAVMAIIGMYSHAQSFFRDRGANVGLGFGFLNASRDQSPDGVG